MSLSGSYRSTSGVSGRGGGQRRLVVSLMSGCVHSANPGADAVVARAASAGAPSCAAALLATPAGPSARPSARLMPEIETSAL
ncbi:MAG: hypothetical protein IPF98_24875 [Gemmatimonadetes bacterium]|nr:hypothetical protein [Gemmatimonadota bacterium]